MPEIPLPGREQAGAGSPSTVPAPAGRAGQLPGRHPRPGEQQQPGHGGPVAVGFPHYVSPPPSPRNRTGLLVGVLVVLVTVLLALLGFWLVSG